jgi:hypothetical protein
MNFRCGRRDLPRGHQIGAPTSWWPEGMIATLSSGAPLYVTSVGRILNVGNVVVP